MTDLYGGTPGHVAGSSTSRAAAVNVAGRAPGMEQQVIDLIASRGDEGLTCFEVEGLLGMRHQTASARIREAVLHGMLVDSGRTRPSSVGDESTVYVRTSRTEPFKVPKNAPKPTKAQVEVFLTYFRALRAQGGTFPLEVAQVCQWIGRKYDIKPEPVRNAAPQGSEQ